MAHSQLCAVVTGSTMAEIRAGRDRAPEADLIELRLDGVADLDVAAALEGRCRPAIVTCRAAWEGGAFTGSEDARRRVLEDALALGAEFVDVEARAAFAPDLVRATGGRRLVLSMHDFEAVPEDLASRYADMRAAGAETVKLAVTPARLSQLEQLFALAEHSPADRFDHVLIGMGVPGLPSRILAARLRSRWTYAGEGHAPGQIPSARLLDAFRFRRIRPDAALYGVVGNPISHSLSPVMHNAGFAKLELNAAYVPLQAETAEDFVGFARAFDLRGASITAPFKVALLPYMDDVDPVARRVGAINTLVVREGRWFGANTDVAGFLAPLAARIRLKGIRVSVLGAGGAARAVAVGLSDEGAAVTVCARRPDAAKAIADLAGGDVGQFPPRPGTWDVLVNTTPAGSAAEPANPIAGADLDGEIVFDLIYSPPETRLMADARRDGCLAIGGIEMLIAQAERQFEMWTGEKPPTGLFESVATPVRLKPDSTLTPQM
jgi:3-dehydroquinate dehydratase / shikimate dehydrogenase